MAWTRLKRLIRPQQVHSDAGESTAAQTARWLVLALAGGLWGSGAYAATNYDLLVNHDAFRFGGLETTEIDAVDAPVGGIFVYRTKSKINGGSGTVSNATLTQRLPATAIFQGIDLPGGVSCTGQPSVGQAIGSNVITCTIGTLTTTEVHVDFKVLIPDDGTEHLAKATITEVGNTDLNPNNSDNIERNITTYKRADLAIAFAAPAANSTHQQGTVVNYQIQVNNTNNEYAFPLNAGEKAVVRFSQPTGTTFQSSPSSPGNAWSCVAGTDTSVMPNVPVYDCTYIAATAIAKNTTLPLITIPVVVAADSGNTTALASVAGQTTGSVNFVDAYTANNTTSVVIKFTPNDQLDMKLAKTVSPAVVDSQAASPVEVTYTLKATRNSGLLIPQGITITDTLPANVSFTGVVSGTDANWSCTSSGQVVSCTFDNATAQKHNLPDLKFTAQVTVGSVALTDGKAVLQNTAVLAVENELVAGANNTSSADLTVTNQIALLTSKAASVGTGPIADGAEFFYTIEVKNDSSIAVQSGQTITVIDLLDGKLQYTGTEGDWACTVDRAWSAITPQTVTCTLSAGIAAKGTNNLKLKVKANLDVGQWAQLVNQASVSCPSGRVCPGHVDGVILTNKHTINLSELSADLSITKAAAITPSSSSYGANASGAEVVYTLKVKNAVPFEKLPANFQTAQTVVVTDTVANLLNSNVSAAAHPVTGTPRYSNDRFIEATVDGSSLPAGMSVEACTYSGSGSVTVSCKLKNVPVSDQEYTITIKARQYVDPTSSAEQTNKITNTASVTSPDTAEFNAGNNTATAEVTLTALTNLTAQMQALPDTGVLAGQKVNYTLSASNQGPSKATDVKVMDALPLGMVWVTAPESSSSATVSCTLANSEAIVAGVVVTAANQLMTCAWTGAHATFSAAATKSITYALRSTNTGYPASVTNNAVARTSTQETIAWDAGPTDNTTSKVVTLAQPELNVLINMGHSKDGLPIDNGTASETLYTITVTNSGESTSYATNVEMMDVFPAAGSTAIFSTTGAIDSVSLVSGTNRFSPSDCQFVTTPESGLKCNFAWLAPNESVAIKFTMKAMSIDNGTVPVGTVLHEARVSADAEYLDGTTDVSKDNTVKDRTSAYDQAQVIPGDVKLIDLSVKKTVTSPASGDSVQVGGQIAYLLTVKNEETGSKHLTGGNAKVVDVLPAGLELVGTVPAGCAYTAATHTLECTITSLNAGASTTFAFTAKVNSVASGQTTVANQATVNSLGDPVDGNNESEVSVPVADLDVGLTKAVNVATANPGQTITYTLTVNNLGTETANGVVVTDTLPAGVGFVASASGCTAAGSTVTCNVGTMAGNSQQALAFTAQVNASATNGAKLNNCAKVYAAGDKNSSNDESCATVTVYVPPPPEPSKPQGSIGCSVFDDLNQNGSPDAGESGVAGITIRLLNAQNQPVTSTVTAADGSYSFVNLTPGTYTVQQDVLKGYTSTTSTTRQVTVLANQKAAACFGVTTNAEPGSIGCSVFNDTNQDGTRDPSEKGLGGLTIRLFNDKDEELATTTAADGNYSFPELAPGAYKVSYVLPKGYSSTSPVERSITVLPGQNAGACFGVLPGKAKPGSVGCSVFDDANNNGERDTGEDGLPGITVRLLDASGKLLSTTTSATDGTYGFPDLPPGAYMVETDFPKGYKPTGSTSRQITVAEGANESVCFGAADGPGVLGIVKTLYEGWNTGAACGTSVAKKELLIVEKIPTEHELTWCFAVTNEGNKHLGAPVWADSEYPGMVATAKAGTTLPLAPGASGTWYFEAKHNSSVVNVVGVEMPVTDPAGKLIPDVPPASSSADGKATFGMIYDPPYGVKVGSVDGADIINWTMVWVNDNIIDADNVYVSDTVKAPMEFVPGSLSCVGEGKTSPIAGTCQYAAGTKTVSVKANFAPDLGKTVANATNRLFISFKVKVPKEGGTTSYKNQGTATWTPPGETDPIDTVTVFVPGVTVDPIDPKDPKVPVVVAPPGVGVDDPSIGRPDPENSGAEVETPVVVVPDAPPPPKPPEPPKPPPTVTSIPTLSEWGVILLSCLMGLLALRQVSFARRK